MDSFKESVNFNGGFGAGLQSSLGTTIAVLSLLSPLGWSGNLSSICF